MLISTETSFFAWHSTQWGGVPYLGAILAGIVNLRPSTSASCFSSMMHSISSLTVAHPGDIPDTGAENISGILFQ